MWPLYPDSVLIFHFGHDESAFPRVETFDGAQGVEHEVLVAVHVLSVDFEHVVEAAGDVVAFGDFGDGLYGLDESVHHLAVEFLELSVAIDDEALVELVHVEHGDVFLYEAFAFEPFHALIDGGGGEVDFGCKFFCGEPGVFLQDAHYLHVDVVECCHR